MRYLKTLFIIFLLFFVIIFCVHNIDSFNLSFLGYHLVTPVQLWLLMLIFFLAGMIPVFLAELPGLVTHYKKMRSLKTQIARMEKEIAIPRQPAPQSSPETPD